MSDFNPFSDDNIFADFRDFDLNSTAEKSTRLSEFDNALNDLIRANEQARVDANKASSLQSIAQLERIRQASAEYDVRHAREMELQAQIAEIVIDDISVGYKKLRQLGLAPNSSVEIGSRAVNIACGHRTLKDRFLFKTHKRPETVKEIDNFWLLGGFIFSTEIKYEEPDYMYGESLGSGGKYRQTTGSSILLASNGDVLVAEKTVNYNGLPLAGSYLVSTIFTGEEQPAVATIDDLVPRMLLVADPIQHPEAYADLTKVAPVTFFRNTITKLITNASK